MVWPFAAELLLMGIPQLLFILIPSVILLAKTKAGFYKGIIVRTLILGVLGLAIFNWDKVSILEYSYGHDPEYFELIKRTIDNPEDKEARDAMDEYWKEKEK